VTTGRLPRSTPSAQDVDAAGVLAFLDAVEATGLDLHSFMLLRHGYVVAEGWWAPYRADQVSLLYSLSKSFTSTAVGMAESEGLLSVDDPVVSFLPDKVPPGGSSSYFAAMKVRHLLAMASGHAEDTWATLAKAGPDIVRTFLALPPDKEPGTLFCYNQGCTYTLSAIITKLTGERLLDYLRPRLFEPLGIEEAYWRQTEGIDQGFSGLHVTTESVAKLGQLYLQAGRWGDRQLVPESYISQARSKQVDNSGHSENPDWQQGYGFQFWMCRHGAYRGDGACGQFCIMVPDADAVIACTAQVADMQAQLDLVWEHLLPAFSGRAAANGDAEERLADRLRRLSTAVIDAPSAPAGPEVTFTRAGRPAPYAERLSALRVEPIDGGTRVTVEVDGAGHSFDLRRGQWTEGELPGLHSLLPAAAISGGWTSGDEFAADAVFLNTPHRLRLRARTGVEPSFEAEWEVPPL
jgi:CubicO group peptidase (beta-lactamase class C family)